MHVRDSYERPRARSSERKMVRSAQSTPKKNVLRPVLSDLGSQTVKSVEFLFRTVQASLWSQRNGSPQLESNPCAEAARVVHIGHRATRLARGTCDTGITNSRTRTGPRVSQDCKRARWKNKRSHVCCLSGDEVSVQTERNLVRRCLRACAGPSQCSHLHRITHKCTC